jgi:hypothetical protein
MLYEKTMNRPVPEIDNDTTPGDTVEFCCAHVVEFYA